MTAPLGRLERVDVRQYWVGEATHFTPWLAQPENITLLGEAIGLDLEVQATEEWVGPFRADILCKDTLRDHYVLIENQLERTDHTHLGQLITYAAGLDAVTIVWLANPFTAEHRSALDWLNRVTDEGINFFGLEIELWRIGESPMAPKFNVISQPNDWQKVVKQQAASVGHGSHGPAQMLYREFWTAFKQYLEDTRSPMKVGTPPADNWTSYGLGRTHVGLYTSISVREKAAWVNVNFDGPDAKANFRAVRDQHRARIEQELGTVEWRELPGNKTSQVRLIFRIDPADRANWPEIHAWMANQLSNWASVFRPIVRTLDAPHYQPLTPGAELE